jgi:hypothetical protein
LPDGIFAYKKIPIWVNLKGLVMKNVGIFFGHYVYFVVIRCILWPLGIFCGHLVCFVAIRYILWSFGKCLVIWYILWPFGILCGHLE